MRFLKILFFLSVGLCFVGCNDQENEDIKYTVSFNSDGGSLIDTQTITKGSYLVKPNDPVKEDAEFLGWFLNDTLFDFEEEVFSDLELVAKWINYYTVRFVVNEEVIKEEKVQEGKSANLPVAPILEGKIFVDWVGDFENITSDVTITAVYDDVGLYVTFIVDGENYGRPILVKYGDDVNTPTDPVKEGYTFIGWDKDLTNVTEFMDVNAVFEPIVYEI